MRTSLKLLLLGDSAEEAEALVKELGRGAFDATWRLVDTEARLRGALRSRWDLVVSDRALANLDGLRAFEIVSRHDATLPFIFVSEPLGEEWAVAAMRAGVRDCLRKGALSNLGDVVHRELERAANLRREQAEKNALAYQQHRYQSVFETSPVAIMEVDLSSARRFIDTFADAQATLVLDADDELVRTAVERIRVLAVNAAAVELLGAEQPEQLMEPKALRSARRNLWLDVLAGVTAQPGIFARRTRVLALDGRRVDVLLAFRRPATAGQLRNVVVSMTDLSYHADIERQVETAQRLEAVGRLAGRVAHDFNNLLTVIKGYTGLLLDTLPESDPTCKDLAIIEEAAGNAEQLTGQLMACNRPQRWEPEPVNLDRQLSHLVGKLRAVVGDRVSVNADLADGLWDVSVDPLHLEEILVNLADNAREAMPEGGRLTLETSNTHLDGGDGFGVGGLPDGDYVLLKVQDTGSGMDEQTLHRAFEPFFTTKVQRGHGGFGLSRVYGIVRQAGGLVWAFSEPGVGCTVELLFPRATAVPGA